MNKHNFTRFRNDFNWLESGKRLDYLTVKELDYVNILFLYVIYGVFYSFTSNYLDYQETPENSQSHQFCPGLNSGAELK